MWLKVKFRFNDGKDRFFAGELRRGDDEARASRLLSYGCVERADAPIVSDCPVSSDGPVTVTP